MSALEKFAKVLAERDRQAGGGVANGAWGAAFVCWVATVKRDHSACGKLTTNAAEYTSGAVDRLAIECPVHGRFLMPEAP